MKFSPILLIVLFSSLASGADTRVLAENMIARLEARDHARAPDLTKPQFDFLHRSQIIIAFPFKYFPLIKQNGFLNQFQVDHSANMDRKHRQEVEDQIIDQKLKRSASKKDPSNELRPKYAYLTLDIDANTDPDYKILNGEHGNHIGYNYGNVFAKLKEDVKKRSTFTAGDSLYILGSKAGDARTFAATQTNPVGAYEYWEAQVWGKLNFDDVEYMLVNCGLYEGQDPAVSSKEIQTIKDAGIDVYQCVPKFENEKFKFGRYRLDKGDKL